MSICLSSQSNVLQPTALLIRSKSGPLLFSTDARRWQWLQDYAAFSGDVRASARPLFFSAPPVFSRLCCTPNQIDHLVGLFRLGFSSISFSSGLHFLFDHFISASRIIIPIFFRIPFRAQAIR